MPETITGQVRDALARVDEQVQKLDARLAHARAQRETARRAGRVQAEQLRAVADVLDAILGDSPAMTLPLFRESVRELRARLRQVADSYGVSPNLVGDFVRTGEGSPCWTVEQVTGRTVRLADGRIGQVVSASAANGAVELIMVEPADGPENVIELHPLDVDFV